MNLQRTLIMGAIIAALVVIIAVFAPSLISHIFSQKKQIEVSKGQAGATADSSAEAMNTISNVQAGDEAADTTLKEATDEVRKAPPGNSNDAALRAACKLRKHLDSERCAALRKADSGKPTPAR